VELELPGTDIFQDEVGERPANIEGNAHHLVRHFLFARTQGAQKG
jgi:hypothetical protein